MLHHLSLPVRNIEAATALYDAALSALGYRRVASGPGFSGYGVEEGKDKLALMEIDFEAVDRPGLHIALNAPSADAVERFFVAALANGARDNGPPGLRAHYGPGYFAAFVIDPDGNRLEAVCKTPGDPEVSGERSQ